MRLLTLLLCAVLASACAGPVRTVGEREAALTVEERGRYGDLPAHCLDGLFNEGEEGRDCGWSCPNDCFFAERCGALERDEVWQGNVHVTCTVTVPPGVELTIKPGTVVKFRHDRDYRTFDRAGLSVEGTVKAVGERGAMIWFTSDAEDPTNGDWAGISVEDSDSSEFGFVVVEFGQMGIEQFDSSTPVTDSIIRWNNAEGLYAERSSPLFEKNLLYSNGYHEIALEQYNEGVVIRGNLFRDGVGAVHNEKTESRIVGNHFSNYRWPPITAGMESEVEIVDNFFGEGVEAGWHVYGGANHKAEGNEFGVERAPDLGFENLENFELGYIPGDEGDRFPYVYAEEDETRRVVKRLGRDLFFGWSLTYADGHLWRFSLDAREAGESLDFIRIDPETGETERYGNDVIMNPRGLTHDGEFFYANDFSLLKVFKFRLEGDHIEVVDFFPIPEKEKGGSNGLATDGEFLYLRKRDGSGLYRLTKGGELAGTLQIPGASLVWTGDHFWTAYSCPKGLCRYAKDGELAGEIYPAADGTWAMAWDGEHLWTIQRTCENWNDPKIYQVEILDDSPG